MKHCTDICCPGLSKTIQKLTICRKFISTVPFILIYFYAPGQIETEKQSYYTLGINAGALGWSPNKSKVIRGSNPIIRSISPGVARIYDVNGKDRLTYVGNSSLGINLGYSWKVKEHYYSISVEMQRNKAGYTFAIPLSFPYKDITTGLLVETDIYNHLAASMQYSWRSKKSHSATSILHNYIKFSVGIASNHKNFDSPVKVNQQETWLEDGTGFKTTVVSASTTNIVLSPEFGKRLIFFNNKSTFDFGLVYHYSLSNSFTKEYEFYSQNNSLGKTQLTFRGSTFHVNLRYTVNFKRRQKIIDSTITTKNSDPVVTHPKKINNRKPKIQNSITIDRDSVILSVWDKNKVDGDIISLYLNGKLILEHYTLSKKKESVLLKLEPGSNFLTLHAVNLGRVPPNTAIFQLGRDKEFKKITLISDEDESGVLEIIYKP